MSSAESPTGAVPAPQATPAVQPAPAPGSRERVAAFLAARDLTAGLVESEHSTKTAAEAAAVAGCALGQIVKSLLVTVNGAPILALVAGDRRADFDALANELGEPGAKIAMASAELVREVTGYAIGGVCPFDLPADLPVVLDVSLQRFETVYPAAGTPRSFVRLTRGQLTEIAGDRWAAIGH